MPLFKWNGSTFRSNFEGILLYFCMKEAQVIGIAHILLTRLSKKDILSLKMLQANSYKIQIFRAVSQYSERCYTFNFMGGMM